MNSTNAMALDRTIDSEANAGFGVEPVDDKLKGDKGENFASNNNGDEEEESSEYESEDYDSESDDEDTKKNRRNV